jgi:PAS domain S-box-containing protein
MPQGKWPDGALTDLAARRDALRQAVGLPGADPRALIGAALTELDGAIEALAAAAPAGGPEEPAPDGLPDAFRAERRLLQVAFQRTPVALFLLEQNGTIRRANDRAAELLGFPSGYATGKPLTSFVDLPFRAAVQTQLAAVARTGAARSADCRILTSDGSIDTTMTAAAIELPGDPPLLMVAAAPAGEARVGGAAGTAGSGTGTGARGQRAGGQRAGGQGAGRQGAGRRDEAKAAVDPAIASMIKRLDMVTAVTRLLLDNSTFSEAVTLQRCARLLAGEMADWVIIDIDRGGQLRRQFAAGARNGQADQLARAVRNVDPEPESVPWQVHSTGKSVLLAHPDDPALLGTRPDGTPLLMVLGAASLICVPIVDGTTGYGTLTLARQAGNGHFGVADLGLAEELGQHLAIAIRVDRMFRQRSEVAEALQASLLPATLPRVPGLEFAAAYIGATQWQEISGDFYDVFPAGDDWAIAIGDVCGKGQDAAAMTAAARHSIRALAHVHDSPAEVLNGVNEVLLDGDYGERFVTASLAFLRRHDRRVQVRLGGCGHPGPAIVRADGRVEILEVDGLPLGLFADAEASRMKLDLHQGDLLFFYTDGVTEARSEDLTFFEDRLADELAAVAGRSAGDTVRAVQELVTTFSRGELRDDVTILAVRVTA